LLQIKPPRHPRVPRPKELAVGVLGDAQEIGGMGRPDDAGVTTQLQLLQTEFPDRFQHPVARRAGVLGIDAVEQAVVDQHLHNVQHGVRGREPQIRGQPRADTVGCSELEAADKGGEPPKDRLL
jgi:hypothetical protein